jgi:PIN domain nuclease of toxin-antitoxin system
MKNLEKIPQKTLEVLSDSNNKIYYSTASIFELAIKISIGKIAVDLEEMVNYLNDKNLLELSIKPKHLTYYTTLPIVKNSSNQKPHKDPFDRILISQSIQDDLLLCTDDSIILTNYTKLSGLKFLDLNAV